MTVIEQQNAEFVATEQLGIGQSPRFLEPDEDHIRSLAESFDQLPPILVSKETMTVIDGVHRLRAARLLGLPEINVEVFSGPPGDVFSEAVRRNVHHGKPLTFPEREAAVTHLIVEHPDWSDRRIASVCGLSSKTVSNVRQRSSIDSSSMSTRIGLDGRRRPTDPARLRLEISDSLQRRPSATLREIAAEVGTSQATVLDVQRRCARGESPLPTRQRARRVPPPKPARRKRESLSLTQDLACTVTPDGREFAGWFDSSAVTESECDGFVECIPMSRLYQVIDESRERARVWTRFALMLEERVGRLAKAR